jgi:hypothetical protein
VLLNVNSAQTSTSENSHIESPPTNVITLKFQVGKNTGTAFVDSGCTFCAISTSFASRCKLKVKTFKEDFVCAIAGGSEMKMQKKLATCVFNLGDLGNFKSDVLIMDHIPVDCEAIFGTDFLMTINPNINWKTRTASPRNISTQHKLRNETEYRNLMMFHRVATLSVRGEDTLVIGPEELNNEFKMAEESSDGTFFFLLNPLEDNQCADSEKSQRYQAQGWDKLKDNPAFPILNKYRDTVFKDKLTVQDVVQDPSVEHVIDLKDDIPVKVKQFRLSPEQQTAVAAWAAEMSAAGLIRPSTSPYSSPIFCVKKPVGWRIVHDYRLLNGKTRIPQEPIPRKDDIIDSMQGGHWFSCMDLLSGYYQLMIREQDRHVTAFSTPRGHFEYLVIAQGLAGAPATFNRFVQSVFKDFAEFCKAFFDDIYIFTKSLQVSEHLVALDKVLQRCESRGLSIKLSKCVFVQQEIPVLGDFVGRSGVRMDPDKVRVIVNWPIPKNKTELKSFLGTLQYCARFCKNYGDLVAPLHAATKGKKKRDRIEFTELQKECFESLKKAMSSAPLLALPNFAKPFGIRMDASDYAIGGVLFQNDDLGVEHPIAYAGRKMQRAELLYPVREKELLAIMFALRTWRSYLLDQPFTVETDHKTLQELLTQQTCTQRLARWLNLLSEFRPSFKWIPGNTNDTADGISRRVDFQPPHGPASSVGLRDLLRSILSTEPNTDENADSIVQFAHGDQASMFYQLLSSRDIAALCSEFYPRDKNFAPVWKFFLEGGQEGDIKYSNFFFRNGLIWKKAGRGELRLCIPNNQELKEKVMFSEHDDPSRGHPGCFKTTNFISRKYYWPKMRGEIKSYIQSCEKCQRNKYRQTRSPGLLHSLPVPEARWQHITMDFILALPLVQEYNAIWVIIDRLTKRAHFIPVTVKDNESTAKACAVIFQREYQRLHGVPETIISDRDCRFTSTFWQTLMEAQGTTHKLSSAFRPNTDGQTERTNRFVEDYLRNYVHANQENWAELLSTAEFSYNSRIHESIGMSPFEADLGYVPRAIPDRIYDNLVGTKASTDILALGRKQQEIMEQLKSNLSKAQARMQKYYNQNRPVQEFEIGDEVFVSAKNLDIAHLGIARTSTKKFGPLWIGPYPVLKKTSQDTYKLQLPLGLRLHPEFHTSLLKPHHKDHSTSRVNKPNEGMMVAGDESGDGYLIEDVVGHKKVGRTIMYRVKWSGYPSEFNTWEPLENIVKPAAGLISNYLEKHGLDNDKWNPKIRKAKRKRNRIDTTTKL